MPNKKETKTEEYKSTHLEFDETLAFNPYCYNCSAYNTKDCFCKAKNKKQEPLTTCVSFNERSNYLEEEIKAMTNWQDKKKKKIEANFSLKIDNYTPNVDEFYEQQPFFYDKTGMFWFWKGNKYEQVDDIDVMNMLDDKLGFMGQTVNSRLKRDYLEAFKRIGRKHTPTEAPKKWIQFNDVAFSIKSGKIYKVTPDYFFTNPIPHEIGKTDKTPVMDKLIEEWVGEKYVKTAYEIIAYCCYSDYPIHMIFCLIGCGRNGKSKFLGLINRFIGSENICSTELDNLLDSRFETAKLYRKLICTLGETNFGTISKTSLLKKLTGQDLIGFEYKNKTPFDDYNYAKILIASNSLPSSTDTSEGFYRRWMILDFPNTFEEGKDILKTIPKEEYSNLAFKITKILPTLISCGTFTNQGSIEERQKRYIMASNPLSIFIYNCCVVEEDEFVKQGELYSAYLTYLKKHKKRRVKLKEFKSALEEEGFWIEKENKRIQEEWKSARWVNGITLKTDWKNLAGFSSYVVCDSILTQPPPIQNQGKVPSQMAQNDTTKVPQETKVSDYNIDNVGEVIK